MIQVYLINQATFADYEDLSVNIKPSRLDVFIKKAQDLDLKPFLGHALYYDFIQYLGYTGAGNAIINSPGSAFGNGVYANSPLTSNTGRGAGATATITVEGGIATNIVIDDPGSGYAIGDQFHFAGLNGAVFSIQSLYQYAVFAQNTPQPYLDLFNGSTYVDRYGHTIIYEGLIPTLVYFTFARFIEADMVQYTATGPVLKHHDNADPVKPSDIIKLVQQQRSVANAHANEVEKFIWDNKADFPLWNYSGKNKSARQAGPRIRSIDRTDFNYPGPDNSGNTGLRLNEFLN